MEEIKTPQKTVNLIQKSGTYNYKLVIPTEVEKKIRFTCHKVWNTEWSGTLFFKPEGSFENNDLVIRCVDIYIMDIGNATYTEFDMNPDVIAYMTNNPELLDCQLGLIHSHCTFSTFFSQTDQATLKEEGRDRNNFVSLIVNNEGTYTAAITRKIKSRKVMESITYEFFGDGEKSDIIDYTSNDEEIEWFYLKIEKEYEESFFTEIDTRLNEIRQQKEQQREQQGFNFTKGKVVQKSFFDDIDSDNTYNKAFNNSTSIINTKENIKKNNSDTKLSYNELRSDYEDLSIKSGTIESLVKQLITCSIIINNESKIDIDKWAKIMPKLCEKRFGKGEYGLAVFAEWADIYIEFITWNVTDDNLETLGLEQSDIQSICARDLMLALSELPENDFIDIYLETLEKYL